MKSLNDMTLTERVITTFIIVVVILLALALIGWATGRWSEAPAAVTVKQECIDKELQAKIRTLALQGFELAFVDRAQRLYDTWTVDPSSAKTHPERGQLGMQNAIHAYVYARSLANNWSVPVCDPKPVGVQ